MTYVVFPDNTVLINFAHINRINLLGTLFPNRQWCATVATECDRSAEIPGLEDLWNAASVFGTPLTPDRAELVDTQLIRTRMASPGDPAHKHLGEAETIAILTRRNLADRAIFVTDDQSAANHASAEGIATISTWEVLKIAHRAQHIGQNELHADCQHLRNLGRGWPPCGHDHAAFNAWLTT